MQLELFCESLQTLTEMLLFYWKCAKTHMANKMTAVEERREPPPLVCHISEVRDDASCQAPQSNCSKLLKGDSRFKH